jgi:hypothetical protein
VAGGSEVTVVWARAPLVETANAESSATKSEAAKRCEDIMTRLEAGTEAFGAKAAALYTARLPVSVTKPRD